MSLGADSCELAISSSWLFTIGSSSWRSWEHTRGRANALVVSVGDDPRCISIDTYIVDICNPSKTQHIGKFADTFPRLLECPGEPQKIWLRIMFSGMCKLLCSRVDNTQTRKHPYRNEHDFNTKIVCIMRFCNIWIFDVYGGPIVHHKWYWKRFGNTVHGSRVCH